MSSTAESPKLLINLEFDQRSYKAADAQRLIFTLTNESSAPITVLKWNTPLEGIKSNMFRVEGTDEHCTYLGRVYKRGLPTAEDYITIQPGEDVSAEVDFLEAYDVSKAGNYRVVYKSDSVQVGYEEPEMLMKSYMATMPSDEAELKAKADAVDLAVRSNTAIFALQEDRQPLTRHGLLIEAESPTALVAEKGASFAGCSAAQQSTITKALAQALKIANEASTALANTPAWARFNSPKRYREWFGEFSSSRYSAVCTHYDKILDALKNKPVVFDCSCNEDYYAYVYPSKPYTIYLCKLFWTAPLAGTDSQGGTILHEISHFYVVASTSDHVYGQGGCRNLANTSPDKAINNADSHEYFAENTPTLTMDAVPGTAFPIVPLWNGMPAGFTDEFSAVLNGAGPFAGKCYFFKGDKYVRYDWANDKADPGYPASIAANWHKMPVGFTSGFDAAINGQGPFAGKCYFFKGDSYVRYDWSADRADPGYPIKIAPNWHGLPVGFQDKFDAIINGAGPFAGKCYFFKGDSYVRYDWASDKVDPGYPLKIGKYWHCLPAGYTSNFNDGLEGDKQFKGKGYFFKGNKYIRYNWAGDYAEK